MGPARGELGVYRFLVFLPSLLRPTPSQSPRAAHSPLWVPHSMFLPEPQDHRAQALEASSTCSLAEGTRSVTFAITVSDCSE